jgi:hypothetical protein
VRLLSSVGGGAVSLLSGNPPQIAGPLNGAGALRLGPLFRAASPALIQGMPGGVGFATDMLAGIAVGVALSLARLAALRAKSD